jgi:hypothetical protein
MRGTRGLLAAIVLGGATSASPQPVSLADGVRAGGLWCFPVGGNPREYVYLPEAVRLARDDAGRPQFSFLRYGSGPLAAGASREAPNTASGGGILHFLVVLETPRETVRTAEQALGRERSDDVVLRGPLVFRDGRYALVSSILNSDRAAPERRVLATGRAPVLEGNRLALSFDLDPQRAALLMQSFALPTPDVSLAFEMTFDAQAAAYDAEVTVDWAEVRKSKAFSAGGRLYFVGAEVELMFDELRRRNAVRLQSRGSDAAMEGLVGAVYARLLDLMFRPVEPERVPAEARGDLLSALATAWDAKGMLSGRNVVPYSAHLGYQLKDLRSEGTSVLHFTHQAPVVRHHLITFNIGDFHRRFGQDAHHFRAVSLDDPVFHQRKVDVIVDGALGPDFERLINTVTVTLRKRHENGRDTVRELVLDRQGASRPAGGGQMAYSWDGDHDRIAWLAYEYRTRWSFQGGGVYQTDWVRTDVPVIVLYAPYERRLVQVAAEQAVLQRERVRSVLVVVEHAFFGTTRRQQVVLRPGADGEPAPLQLTLPTDQPEYEYAITWQLEGGRQRGARGRGSSGLLFVDELPREGDRP